MEVPLSGVEIAEGFEEAFPLDLLFPLGHIELLELRGLPSRPDIERLELFSATRTPSRCL